jgi:hypothetical protein
VQERVVLGKECVAFFCLQQALAGDFFIVPLCAQVNCYTSRQRYGERQSMIFVVGVLESICSQKCVSDVVSKVMQQSDCVNIDFVP